MFALENLLIVIKKFPKIGTIIGLSVDQDKTKKSYVKYHTSIISMSTRTGAISLSAFSDIWISMHSIR